MCRWRSLLFVAALAACGHDHPTVAADAAVDGAIDAAIDAQPDASAWSLSIDTTPVIASPLQPRTLTITGIPGAMVAVEIDRATAGKVSPANLTLDANGKATTMFAPCSDVLPDCLGAAALHLVLATDPATTLDSASFTLVAPPDVGVVAPCLTGGD